jgi:hypothetical protein
VVERRIRDEIKETQRQLKELRKTHFEEGEKKMCSLQSTVRKETSKAFHQ